jgi:GTP pyrophosphokinase
VKIRNFLLKKEEAERKATIVKGEQIFKDEVKKRGLENSELVTRAKVESVLHQFNLKTMDECYYSLAARSLTTAALFEKLVDQRKNILDLGFGRLFKPAPQKKTISKSGIKVSGVDSMMISLSQCCKPVYGDEIIGYITKGQGVKVHRIDCPNIIKEKSRLIEVMWDETFDKGKYEVELSILANDRSYLLTDIVTVVSQYKASIQSVNSIVNEDKVTATTTIKVNVDDSNHLQVLIVNLRKVNSVISVERITR